MTEWKLDGWALDPVVTDWIVKNVPSGSTILEMGSGEGTGFLAEAGFKMISIEHGDIWIDKYDSTYVYAPIDLKARWYDPKIVEKAVTGLHYDLLLVDGPTSCRDYGRKALVNHIHLFNTSIPMIFDDTATPKTFPWVKTGRKRPERMAMEKVLLKIGEHRFREIELRGRGKSASVMLPKVPGKWWSKCQG